MTGKNYEIDRRFFLKTMGGAALGSAIAANGSQNSSEQSSEPTKYPQIPKRKLGKTGVEVPIVALGCLGDYTKLHHVFDTSLQYGMYYWDTATNYSRTRSQLGIGQYIEKYPDVRKKLFLLSKPVDIKTPTPIIADLEKDLQESLERTKTKYFDVYLAVHALTDPAQLTDELKKWGEDCKKRGLFKYIGFSAHENMAPALLAAAKCGWIDVAMVSYNFQLKQSDEYQKAIDVAHKANVGLIAIKTQRRMTIELSQIESEADKKMADHFLERGFTEGQAKLKFVLDDERFASAAVGMSDLGILTQNVAAALDKTKLSQEDKAVLDEYARATCDGYCAGCSHICNGALPDMPYVNHIMRYMMYYTSYGHRERARELFASIPANVRGKLLNTDYSLAETRCPQRIPIGKVVAEAVRKLS